MPLAIALIAALLAAQTTPVAPSTDPASSPAPTQAAPANSTCHQPDTSGLYDHVCGVIPPSLVYKVDPEIPEAAGKRKFVSIIDVAFTVGTDGNPTDVHVVDSQIYKVDKKSRGAQEALEDNAVAAVKQYRFAPATYQGKPVPVSLHVEIQFQIL